MGNKIGSMTFLIRTLSNAFALWVAVFLISGLSVVTTNAPAIVAYLVAGAILAGVNTFVRPIVKFFSLPLYLLTLGLFFLVVNALMLMLTSWVSGIIGIGVSVAGFWWAVLGGIVIGIVNWIIDAIADR